MSSSKWVAFGLSLTARGTGDGARTWERRKDGRCRSERLEWERCSGGRPAGRRRGFVLPITTEDYVAACGTPPSGGGRFISTSTASSPMPLRSRVVDGSVDDLRVLAATSMACRTQWPALSERNSDGMRRVANSRVRSCRSLRSLPRQSSGTVELVPHSCDVSSEVSPEDLGTFVVVQERPGKLRLLGELDLAGVPEVWARLEGVNVDVELDGAGLTFIDASGLRLSWPSRPVVGLEVRGC